METRLYFQLRYHRTRQVIWQGAWNYDHNSVVPCFLVVILWSLSAHVPSTYPFFRISLPPPPPPPPPPPLWSNSLKQWGKINQYQTTSKYNNARKECIDLWVYSVFFLILQQERHWKEWPLHVHCDLQIIFTNHTPSYCEPGPRLNIKTVFPTKNKAI